MQESPFTTYEGKKLLTALKKANLSYQVLGKKDLLLKEKNTRIPLHIYEAGNFFSFSFRPSFSLKHSPSYSFLKMMNTLNSSIGWGRFRLLSMEKKIFFLFEVPHFTYQEEDFPYFTFKRGYFTAKDVALHLLPLLLEKEERNEDFSPSFLEELLHKHEESEEKYPLSPLFSWEEERRKIEGYFSSFSLSFLSSDFGYQIKRNIGRGTYFLSLAIYEEKGRRGLAFYTYFPVSSFLSPFSYTLLSYFNQKIQLGKLTYEEGSFSYRIILPLWKEEDFSHKKLRYVFALFDEVTFSFFPLLKDSAEGKFKNIEEVYEALKRAHLI